MSSNKCDDVVERIAGRALNWTVLYSCSTLLVIMTIILASIYLSSGFGTPAIIILVVLTIISTTMIGNYMAVRSASNYIDECDKSWTTTPKVTPKV